MSALVKHLAAYGAYHRDPRNLATHLVGVPMIVVAVAVLLSRPVLALSQGLSVTPAMLAAGAAALFYLRLDLRFGLAMAALLALVCRGALFGAALPTSLWLATGLGLFVTGWAIQFVGHWFEGRKPAFLDDLAGLIVAPVFLVAEVAFRLGLRRDVSAALHEQLSRR